MNPELLILVDETDREIGLLEKMRVHEEGLLHRAFSVFVFNSRGELLLQQRAKDKYHSPGVWSNTCCSHPRAGETTAAAASRRLNEEMGFTCDLEFAFSFTYKASFENGLTEYEFDHVFVGYSDDIPFPNPSEVHDWKYMTLEQLKTNLQNNPEDYSVWLGICFPRLHLQLADHLSTHPFYNKS